MIWAVLDTNVLVSGLGWRTSAPGRLVDLAVEGRFVLATSEPLLDELKRVLAYPRLAPFLQTTPELTRLVAEVAVVVEPTGKIERIERDPADNRVLEAAAAAHADHIVSGDRDLLDLGEFEGIAILRPREFLSLLER